jgi:protein involved in polysaccharide export with SLBB domain
MIGQLRKMAAHWVVALGLILVGLSNGCQTGSRVSDLPAPGTRFHVGDLVTISFISALGDATIMPVHAERVHEDGIITLSLIGPITAVGKTTGELQSEIHDRYVPKYYPDLTVTVAGEATFFYVDGEVVARGQKEYPGQMTVVKAISAAGGFTDFAKKSKVRLTREGHSEIINVDKAIKDPKYDVAVYPGDKIYVYRRLW